MQGVQPLRPYCSILAVRLFNLSGQGVQFFAEYSADLYDSASIEAKKMIVNSMIKRIDVFRDYKLKIEFTFDIKQFFLGIDKEITFDMTA